MGTCVTHVGIMVSAIFYFLFLDLQLAQSEDPHGMRGPHPHASMPVLSDDELSSDSESDTDPDIPSGM